jgi:hypothetical protein
MEKLKDKLLRMLSKEVKFDFNFYRLDEKYYIDVTARGITDKVLPYFSAKVIKEVNSWIKTKSDADFEVSEDYEGILEIDDLNRKDYLKLKVSCRPGNLEKYISNSDLLKFARAFINQSKG